MVEKALNLDGASREIEELETAGARPDFWNDVENSQRVQKRLKTLKDKTEKFSRLRAGWDDMMTLCDMLCSSYLAKNAIVSDDMSKWQDGLVANYTATQQFAIRFASIG